MKRKKREVELVYYDPNVLTEIMDEASHNCLSWEEMIENIELGDEELAVLLRLKDSTGLDATEIACLYLYYWMELPEREIGERLNLPRTTIEYILIRAKKKLRPELIKSLVKNA